jgi:hypothetical protein
VNAANLVHSWPQAVTATKLEFTTRPASSYIPNMPFTVKVMLEDASGGVVASNNSAVTLTLSGGTAGAILTGTTTVAASSGVATFTGLSVNTAGTAYTLTAADGTLTSATSSAFNITAAPSKLTFSQQPTNATGGVSIAPAIVVHVADASSNPVAGDPITLSIAANPGSSTLSGGSTVSTNSNGNATFSAVSLSTVGTGYTLNATDGSSTPLSVTSTAFNITAGPPTAVVFSVEPVYDPSFTADQTIPFAAQVVDAGGNPVGAGQSLTLSLSSGPAGAVLSGTTTAVTDATGTATFGSPTPISLALVGNYALTAKDTTNATLAPAVSSPFSISAGAPKQLVFTPAPANVMQGAVTSATVSEEDASGNVTIADSSSVVAVSVSGCGGTVLLQNVVLSKGVATVSNLRFYTVATGVQLSATSAALTGASASFNVSANANLIFANGFASCRP